MSPNQQHQTSLKDLASFNVAIAFLFPLKPEIPIVYLPGWERVLDRLPKHELLVFSILDPNMRSKPNCQPCSIRVFNHAPKQ